MKIRFFLPKSLYFNKNLKCDYIFGKIVNDLENKCISVFVVDTHSDFNQSLPCVDLIGQISENLDGPKDIPLNYVRLNRCDNLQTLDIKSIHLHNFEELQRPYDLQILLYDLAAFEELSQRDDIQFERNADSISKLLLLIKDKEKMSTQSEQHGMQIIIALKTISTFFQSKFSFVDSAFWRHCVFWSSNLEFNIHRNGYIWTILFDVFAGIAIMLCLWHVTNADDYLMKFTMVIVKQLQQLLDALNGSPVGLKLNVELNNFFLSCFRYNVDLWATFLIIIAPLIKYLFVPLSIIGCLGLSFQLSMLIDLLNVITLHCHCIYVYASILHRIEIDGLIGFWRIVSGRRKNVMKDRIESYDYTNPQLYLSTIFFAALLFLLPTFLVYFVVFASLQFVFYCIIRGLTTTGQKLLAFPVTHIVKWCLRKYVSCDNFRVIHLRNLPNQTLPRETVSLFSIETVQSTFPSWIDLVMEPKKNTRQT